MNAFRVRHLENFLNRFDETSSLSQPLDLFLKRYFAAHKTIDSLDKTWISTSAYDVMKWKLLVEYVTQPPITWSSRLKTYFCSLRWKANTLNGELDPHIRCSFPDGLFKRLELSLGTSRAMQTCLVLNEPAPVFLRVNLNKVSRDRLARFLDSKGIPAEKSPSTQTGLQLVRPQRLLDLPEYQQGMFELQDESSQVISDKIDCQPGQIVLDYCAGAGGKAVVFGPKLGQTGRVYLHDSRPHMLLKAKARLRTAGLKNFVALQPDAPHLDKLKKKADWVVCDVPCTSTGSLRRNPEIKWLYTDRWLFELVSLQRDIFAAALQYMKPSGKIVYATCSIFDEENIQQVKYFLHKFDLQLVKGYPINSLPQSRGMDGYFIAVFEKKVIEQVELKVNKHHVVKETKRKSARGDDAGDKEVGSTKLGGDQAGKRTAVSEDSARPTFVRGASLSSQQAPLSVSVVDHQQAAVQSEKMTQQPKKQGGAGVEMCTEVGSVGDDCARDASSDKLKEYVQTSGKGDKHTGAEEETDKKAESDGVVRDFEIEFEEIENVFESRR